MKLTHKLLTGMTLSLSLFSTSLAQQTVDLPIIKHPNTQVNTITTTIASYNSRYDLTIQNKNVSEITIKPNSQVIHQNDKRLSNNFIQKKSWNGSIHAPKKMFTPGVGETKLLNKKSANWHVKPIQKFGMGTENETFVFMPAATVHIKTDTRNTNLWVAPIGNQNQIDNSQIKLCKPNGPYCSFDTESVNSFLLFSKVYGNSQAATLTYGTQTSTPSYTLKKKNHIIPYRALNYLNRKPKYSSQNPLLKNNPKKKVKRYYTRTFSGGRGYRGFRR